MDEPRWFKKKFCFASKYLKILPPVLLKILLPISRGFLLTWDVVKDVTLWVFLYNRIGFLLESEKNNGYFVVGLIWFNLATILFAQCLMGAYILKRANKIIIIPESVGARVVLYCILVLMLPFVPCILLLQISSIATQESRNILQWQEVSSSHSSVARFLIVIRKE